MSEWFQSQENTDAKTPEDDRPVTGDGLASDTPPVSSGWRSDEHAASETPESPAEPAPEKTVPSATEWRSNPYTTPNTPPSVTPPPIYTGASVTNPAQPDASVQSSAPEKSSDTDAPAAEPASPPTPPTTPPSYAGGWYRSGPTGSGNGGTPPPYRPWNGAPQNVMPPIPPQPPKKKSSNGVVITLAVVGSLAALALIVVLGVAMLGYMRTDHTTPDVSVSDDSEVINNDAPSLTITDWADNDGGLSPEEVINCNIDSTVVISTFQMRSPSNFNGYSFGTQTLTQVGEASGIIMTEDGYIITNWHVVTDEDTGELYDRVDVTTHDGTVYEDAKVIGADQSTDLAVIKINTSDLSVAEFGDSSKLTMGNRVLALGNAGGLQWSASQGIISGLARDVYEDTGYSIKCLQTDAAINPGNSGGPLINNQGQVIGVNSSKIAATGYEGLGFSIPINEAKTIIDDLIKFGYVRGRVQLGITGFSVNSNGYHGFVVQSIRDNSVLKNTQIRVGDLITAVDGEQIDGYGALRSKLAARGVGATVTLSVLRLDSRTGHETTFTVTFTLVESQG